MNYKVTLPDLQYQDWTGHGLYFLPLNNPSFRVMVKELRLNWDNCILLVVL